MGTNEGSGGRGEPTPRDSVPEVLGHIVDDEGREREVHRGPIQNDALTPDQLRRVARIRDALAEAYPMTLDGWVDGFLRDAHPESEIRIVEACASVYQRLSSGAELSGAEKRKLYSTLCLLSMGAPAPGLEPLDGTGLPGIDAIDAMLLEALKSGARP